MENHVQKKWKKNDALERCVLCHSTVNVKRLQPIHMRKHYVEGAGQLCGRCFHVVYED